jgi:cohesin loading factor subunit SCC2
LLAVLYWPEYPAASLLLSIATKFMVCSLCSEPIVELMFH